MAIKTLGGQMGACQREVRLVVVKAVLAFPGRMAVQAGLADVNITSDLVVLFVGVCLVVFMAGNTAELRVVVRVGVTFCATVPGPVMRSGIDREILGIMFGKCGGLPSRCCRVAEGTILGNSDIDMVGVRSGYIIFLMASVAFGWGLSIITCLVAGAAILYVMPFRQWEEVVVDTGGGPGKGVHLMTIRAIGGKLCGDVIRIGGRIVIVFMAGDAFHFQWLKI